MRAEFPANDWYLAYRELRYRLMNLAILASHYGSTLQAILDAYGAGTLSAVPRLVISNNSGSEALQRAKRAGVSAFHLSLKTHPVGLDAAIVEALRQHDIDVVVLAGYMKKLGPEVIQAYAGRILNTHPALLPKYGGQGMFGNRVHEAVLAAGDPESGVTIHWVDRDYDTGPPLAQQKVPVYPTDDVAALASRVQKVEKELLVETLDQLARGVIALPELN